MSCQYEQGGELMVCLPPHPLYITHAVSTLACDNNATAGTEGCNSSGMTKQAQKQKYKCVNDGTCAVTTDGGPTSNPDWTCNSAVLTGRSCPQSP